MESVGAVEATLSSAATTIALVHQGMAAHKLGRAGTKNLLGQVADRGPVDGRLIDQARKDRRTEQYAYYLLSEYARLLEWLADQHFSVPAAAVSWYDPRRVVVGAYRVPLVFANRRSRELKELVDSIKELAGKLVAENVSECLACARLIDVDLTRRTADPSRCECAAYYAVGRAAAQRRSVDLLLMLGGTGPWLIFPRFHCLGTSDRGREDEGEEWYLMGIRWFFSALRCFDRLSVRACRVLTGGICTIYTRDVMYLRT